MIEDNHKKNKKSIENQINTINKSVKVAQTTIDKSKKTTLYEVNSFIGKINKTFTILSNSVVRLTNISSKMMEHQTKLIKDFNPNNKNTNIMIGLTKSIRDDIKEIKNVGLLNANYTKYKNRMDEDQYIFYQDTVQGSIKKQKVNIDDPKKRKTIIRDFAESWIDAQGNNNKKWQDKMLKAVMDLKSGLIGMSSRIQIAWQNTLLNHPMFRNLTLMGDVFKSAFSGVMGLLFSPRGGDATEIKKATNTSNVFAKISNMLALIYTGIMPNLRQIKLYNQELVTKLVGEKSSQRVQQSEKITWTVFDKITNFIKGDYNSEKGLSELLIDQIVDNLNLDKDAVKRAGLNKISDFNPFSIWSKISQNKEMIKESFEPYTNSIKDFKDKVFDKTISAVDKSRKKLISAFDKTSNFFEDKYKYYKSEYKEHGAGQMAVRAAIRGKTFGQLEGKKYFRENDGFDYKRLMGNMAVLYGTGGWYAGDRYIGEGGKINTDELMKTGKQIKNIPSNIKDKYSNWSFDREWNKRAKEKKKDWKKAQVAPLESFAKAKSKPYKVFEDGAVNVHKGEIIGKTESIKKWVGNKWENVKNKRREKRENKLDQNINTIKQSVKDMVTDIKFASVYRDISLKKEDEKIKLQKEQLKQSGKTFNLFRQMNLVFSKIKRTIKSFKIWHWIMALSGMIKNSFGSFVSMLTTGITSSISGLIGGISGFLLKSITGGAKGIIGLGGILQAGTDFLSGAIFDSDKWLGIRPGEKDSTLLQRIEGGIGAALGGTSKAYSKEGVLWGMVKGAAIGAPFGGPIGAGIGALAGGILGFVGGENIAKSLQLITDSIASASKAVWKLIKSPIVYMKELVGKAWTAIKEKTANIWDKAQEAANMVVDNIKKPFYRMKESIDIMWYKFGEKYPKIQEFISKILFNQWT
jgi:hypothetical protein